MGRRLTIDGRSASVDEALFRATLGHFATGVTVVTAIHGDRPVGFTCQAFASLSLKPPLVMLAPAKTSTSWPFVAEVGSFCVNVLARGQQALSRAFSESGADKFSGASWHPGTAGAPRLDGALAWIDCQLDAVYDGGDHLIAVGRVVGLGSGQGEPLVFYRGRFTHLS